MSSHSLESSVAELRRTFDETFAAPLAPPSEAPESLLTLRVAGDRFAIRLSEISGLISDVSITPLPSPAPELLGIASIKGRIVPAYSLATLLGYPLSNESSRWLVLCGTDHPVGLSFSEFEQFLNLPASALCAAPGDQSSRFSNVLAQTGLDSRPVINIPRLLNQISGKSDSKTSNP